MTSVVGRESTFRFTLPLRVVAGEPGPSDPTPPETAGRQDAPRARVLVVDDDAAIQRLLRGLLTGEGYEVGVAGDGLQALAQLEHGPYHVVLLDLMMPGLGGEAFVHELERRGLRGALRIVVMSASPSARSRSGAIGADEVIEKPFDLDRVVQAVGAAVERD